ncbi:MAG: DUF58 domain-containing protein [Gammaproteobacteria bacterium]|nr:DUF58 domain-containing protein [Pseudomonadales bacterium]
MFNFNFKSWIASRMERWADHRNPPAERVVLNRRNILILPTTQGLLFLLAGLIVFLAAINYENSLAFGLAFFMVSLFVVSMFHAFNNLHGLQLSGLPANPVFCGEDAAFQVLLSRRGKRPHEALELYFRDSPVTKANLVMHGEEKLSVFSRTTSRGLYNAPRLIVSTRFPTGLFRAWSLVNLKSQCLVYPRPVPVSLAQVFNSSSSEEETALVREGTDDFYGFRSFNPGDSLRQVAWKNVARGQGMLVKQFVDYIDERLLLDWDLFYGFTDEERLSRLCYCLLKLSGSDASYGLRLPGVEIAPDTGKQHRLTVLQALALYRRPAPGQRSEA